MKIWPTKLDLNYPKYVKTIYPYGTCIWNQTLASEHSKEKELCWEKYWKTIGNGPACQI